MSTQPSDSNAAVSQSPGDAAPHPDTAGPHSADTEADPAPSDLPGEGDRPGEPSAASDRTGQAAASGRSQTAQATLRPRTDRRLYHRVTLGLLLLLGLGFGAFAGLLIAPELDRGRPSPAAGLASEIAALREDISRLAAQNEAAPAATTSPPTLSLDAEAMQAALDTALEARLEAALTALLEPLLEQAVARGLDARLEGLVSGAVEAELAGLELPAPSVSALESLTQKLDETQQSLAQLLTAVEAQLATKDAEIAALQAEVLRLRAAPPLLVAQRFDPQAALVLLPNHPSSPEIEALRERLAALQDFEPIAAEALAAEAWAVGQQLIRAERSQGQDNRSFTERLLDWGGSRVVDVADPERAEGTLAAFARIRDAILAEDWSAALCEVEVLDASLAQAAQLQPLRAQLELQAALAQTQADFIAYLTEQGE